ncbi:hypothetical protein BG011_007842 [Mortierella polycephala]|uniref:Uncharacterized protein n=1 Tax=Mortierella polycephala TaxID=41804 RepID=A0A9P6U8M0_9FUNG|nr:hypothetical protein BG011_007842 [Mortierella polycephala]
MNPTRSSYVEYGTGNMLNLDAGTIKRKIDSNEYDDEIIQEAQPNGKRTCGLMNQAHQFATFGTSGGLSAPQTPNGQSWPQSSPSTLPHTAMASSAHHSLTSFNGTMNGFHTPESAHSSVTVSPLASSMDMDMESTTVEETPTVIQNANAMLNTAISTSMTSQTSSLLPSALPGQHNQNEYVQVHGRSMEIPSHAHVPLNEGRKYREQRWSSCIYGADTRIGQGMML